MAEAGRGESITNSTLNKLRAAVLGANDGIVSISALVMGVAGAGGEWHAIFIAGLAALVAGALSMAVGEYVSVSSQSDAEKAFIAREKQMLKDNPAGELEELADAYIEQGVSKTTAHIVARELTAKNALKAHLRMHFNLDEEDLNSPMHAAVSSLVAFTIGGAIPFLTIILVPASARVWATTIAVGVSLLVVGYFSASVGGASRRRAMARVLIGGILAMAITYGVGFVFGTNVS
jgi:VIT1/CCC1 family predicted Fe2+/Mn2+ transporter